MSCRSGHLLSGQTVYLKLRPGVGTIGEMAYRFPDGSPMGGIKMANGTNPQGAPPFPAPDQRPRRWCVKISGSKYQRDLEAMADEVAHREILAEAVEALEGKRVVHHHLPGPMTS